MANTCMISGRGTRAGRSRSRSMRQTRRTFKPNLIHKVIELPTGEKMNISIRARYYKKLMSGERVKITHLTDVHEYNRAKKIVDYFVA